MNINKSKNTIVRPVLTEKSIRLAGEENKYTFLVDNKASKVAIAKAIAEKFAVKVLEVTTANFLGKKVSFGKKRVPGVRSNFKKAVIKLKSGDKISVFDIK